MLSLFIGQYACVFSDNCNCQVTEHLNLSCMNFRTLVSLIIIGLFVLFAFQNTETTDIEFLFWQISGSRVLIILGSFLVGVLVGMLMPVRKRYINAR